MKHLKILTILLCFYCTGVSQSQWDIRFNQSSLSCMSSQVCYQLEIQNTGGSPWALGDQNYRFFFDGDYMTIVSVTSLLSNTIYGAANIDQNVKISGAGQEIASPLDDIDDHLGFLDFSIIQSDKSNPSSAQQISNGIYTPVAEICVDVDATVLNDNTGSNCLGFYHSRQSTAGAITNQYTVLSENNASGSTISTVGGNYDDLTGADGDMACLGNICAPPIINEKEWDIQLNLNSFDCDTEQACYYLQVKNHSGAAWALGDQNYRLFFDGDLMTVTSVSSLLPNNLYGNAVIEMNTKYSSTGQEMTSPLDNIDDNLGFLDFNIIQTDKTAPTTSTQLMTGTFTDVAAICVDVDASVFNDSQGNTCLSFYHSRSSTAGTFTGQYTTLTEHDAPNSTAPTSGVTYDDLTSMDGADACLGLNCTPERQWDIQLSRSSFDCDAAQVCYQLEVQNTSGSNWTIGDQNYRLFFDGDYMTVTSVTSLLPNLYYADAVIDMNTKYSGTGQEAASPLDDIDDNLGFLDFNIIQTDKTNPGAATQLITNVFTPVAEICVDVAAVVINDPSGTNCLAFYHSRPPTAGTFTGQYTTISEHDAPNSTATTMGANYDDLTEADGSDACLGLEVPSCDIMGMSMVMENQQNEVFSGPMGLAAYSWSVLSGDASIDGATNQSTVIIDFGSTNSTLELTTTHSSGCMRTCTYEVMVMSTMDAQWDIQLSQSSLDCATRQVCYQLELQNTMGDAWTLGDQNYRLFFDGDLMTVTSVTSLLPTNYYGTAVIEMNTKYMGQGQEQVSPLDDIDDHLGFLDFNILQTDKTNPAAATRLMTGVFRPVAEICVDVSPTVFDDMTGNTCLAFYHSRPSTAGSFTSQYTTITENDAMNSTAMTMGMNYNDLTTMDGADVCLGLIVPTCDIIGNTMVVENTTGEVYTAPAGMSAYEWNVIGGNASINGGNNQQMVTIDFQDQAATIELRVTNNTGCEEVCTIMVSIAPPESEWNIRLSLDNLDCPNNQVCYQLELQSNSDTWTLGDQNYRLFFDGDLMTVNTVTSLLPNAFYADAVIDMNNKYSGIGQDVASPLDDIDNNLGFLDFNIIQTDKSNPNSAIQIVSSNYTAVAQICATLDASVLADDTGGTCVSFYHSRLSTAGMFTNQYTTITENNAPNNTVMTMGANYDDLTAADGVDACLGLNIPTCGIMGASMVDANTVGEVFSGPAGMADYQWSIISGDAMIIGSAIGQTVSVNFGTMPATIELTVSDVSGCAVTCSQMVSINEPARQWDIQLSQTSLDCAARQVCYQLELLNTMGSPWTLGDQNYRLFFDGDYMTVTSVSSLLPTAYYGNAVIDMNTKYSGTGQEASSPLDDIDDNLGFLDFNIIQIDKTNPGAATQLMTGGYSPVAEICVEVDEVVINDQTGSNCLSFYHSRPSTAGTFTSQYTTITENDIPNNTSSTMGQHYDDLTPIDGAASCVGLSCGTDNEWNIQLSQGPFDCMNNTVCYQLEVQSNTNNWALGDQNYRLFFDGDLMTVISVSSLLPNTIYSDVSVDMNTKYSGSGQDLTSPLDDIDDNLGFLDFNILQIDKTNPGAATQITTTSFTSVAQICVELDELVFNDPMSNSCVTFYHSRPSTAGTFTSQYTTITENDAANQTTPTTGVNYDDLTSDDGDLACLSGSILPMNDLVVSDTTVCDSTFAVPLIFASEIGVSYQLRDDATGNIIAGPIMGNGMAIGFTINDLTPIGTYSYTVVATNNTTGCSVVLLDKAVIIVQACDFPDYPPPNCPAPPCHVISDQIYLGEGVSSEAENSGTFLANTDDDDGVYIPNELRPGVTVRFPTTIYNVTGNVAYLNVWVDWNGDQDFEDSGELIITNAYDPAQYSGTFLDYVETTIPSNVVRGQSIAMRFRLSTLESTISNPCGTTTCAPDGEIEDYLIMVSCPPRVCLPVGVTVFRNP